MLILLRYIHELTATYIKINYLQYTSYCRDQLLILNYFIEIEPKRIIYQHTRITN